MSLLPETQAAAKLGFWTMSDFERALANGEIPAPVRQIRHGRRKIRMWSDKEIDQWIDGDDQPSKEIAISGLR